MEKEIWKDVVGYEGLYSVSNLGNVKSYYKNGHNVSTSYNKGYENCPLSKNNIRKTFKVHTLVAMAFLNHTPCSHKYVVDHINGDRSDNRLCNLRIVEGRFNFTFGYRRDRGSKASILAGAYFDKKSNKWYSAIRNNKKYYYLGRYNSDIDAHNAYMKKLMSFYTK